MKTLNYTTVRANLAKVLDDLSNDAEPVLISRPNKPDAVLMSLEQYESYEETLYLLSTPNNVAALMESIAQIDRGEVIEMEFDHEKGLLQPPSNK